MCAKILPKLLAMRKITVDVIINAVKMKKRFEILQPYEKVALYFPRSLKLRLLRNAVLRIKCL